MEGPQSAKSHPLTAAIKTCFRGWPVSHLARSILGTALLPSCLTPQVAASASSKTRKSDPEIVGGCSLHRHDPRHVFAKFLFKISDLTRVVAPGVGVGVGCRCSTDRRLVTRRSSSRRYVVTSCRCHERFLTCFCPDADPAIKADTALIAFDPPRGLKKILFSIFQNFFPPSHVFSCVYPRCR